MPDGRKVSGSPRTTIHMDTRTLERSVADARLDARFASLLEQYSALTHGARRRRMPHGLRRHMLAQGRRLAPATVGEYAVAP